ncbi:MAG: hypothetical protein PF590_01345 [Candidatus Delongbacteria bacterium]|jgi:hypothetical protein|nr:hypothetical protein [Candidatus Delongbacteria bacterium]
MKKNREVINGTIDSVSNLCNASIFTKMAFEVNACIDINEENYCRHNYLC